MASSDSTPPLTYLRAIGLAAVAVALVPRALGTGMWWLNPDEGIYLDILTSPTAEDFWEGVRWNAHPPLYYLLLRGVGALTWDFWWYRAVSLVAGCAAVLAVWLCGLELGGHGRRGMLTGTIVALVVALSPWAVEASQIMRPYTLLLALVSLGLYFLLRHLRTRERSAAVGYAACMALALLTHYSTLPALAVCVLLVAVEIARGNLRGRARTDLLLAHVAPVLVAVGLYVVHLRPRMTSTLSANALQGWLLPYMPSTVSESWMALLGFFAMVAGGWLTAPLALLLVGTLAWSALRRDWRPMVLGVGGLTVALALSWTGQYPFGGTRHSAWLIPFLLLPPASVAARALASEVRVARVAVPAGALLVALGGPLGQMVGVASVVPPQPERTLRRADLGAMLGRLATVEDAAPLIMNRQTYYQLLPLFLEQRDATGDDEPSFFRFRWLDRDVIVSDSWDLRVGLGQRAAANHFYDLLGRVDDALPEMALADRRRALVLAGGWPPAWSTGNLGALNSYEGVVQQAWAVRGLELMVTDLVEYTRVVSGETVAAISPGSGIPH